MQFVGLLLIVNSLLGGAWWVASGRPQMVVLPVCVAAMTAGVFLIIHDRSSIAAESKGAAVAQAPGMDELARQTAEAKAVLADLEDQTAAADWHLKQLDQHIQEMKILPDGRTRIGNTVTGQATVLIPKLEALQKLATDAAADALPLARECVTLHESTREAMKGVTLSGGDLGPETTAWLYLTASTAAQRMDDHDQALTWARAAVALRPTAERQFLLVTALINKSLQAEKKGLQAEAGSLKAEANTIIQRELKAGGPEIAKFRQYLDQYNIPYK